MSFHPEGSDGAALNGASDKIEALTAALAGMVRLHCARYGSISVSCVENMQAVRLLADAGLVEIKRNGAHVVEGVWTEGSKC